MTNSVNRLNKVNETYKLYRPFLKKLLKRQITRGQLEIKTPSDKYKYALAYFLSRLFGPLPLVCVIWIITAAKSGIGFWKAIWVYPLIFVIVIAIPLTITTYLVLTKRVKDIEWSDINERNRYLPPITLISLIFLLLLTKLFTSPTIFHLSLLLSVIVITMLLIYLFFRFKVSGHLALAALTVSAINLYWDRQFLWLFLLLIPLVWARHTLKVHTLSELISGFLIPEGIILLALAIFGWPKVQ